ncbi:MAG: GAF domain-containing protein [Candidatus Methanofastidiosia archaeon]
MAKKDIKNQIKSFHQLLEKIGEIADSSAGRDEKLKEICKLLRDNIPHYAWVGFYTADTAREELVLGPFAGAPAEHKRIPFGRGTCGQAAERKETFIVQDISKETNYLSCNLKVQSEIVVPIFKDGEVIGEIDIDSHSLSPFTQEDRKFLEDVCKIVSDLF